MGTEPQLGIVVANADPSVTPSFLPEVPRVQSRRFGRQQPAAKVGAASKAVVLPVGQRQANALASILGMPTRWQLWART